jgi:hypothetical protein
MRNCAITALSLTLFIAFTGCAFKRKDVRTVQMGEKAVIGPFIYQAYDTQWPISLGDRTAKDRFFIIRLSILNSGSADTTIPSLEVVDDQGNSYPEEANGAGVEGWLGLSRKVGTGQTEQGTIVFDVAAKHYRLRAADENDNFMYIDIPLNLNSEEPTAKKLQDTAPLTSK